jgi:ATP-binding cassette, subfamily C (CFTR/MRP), member 1
MSENFTIDDRIRYSGRSFGILVRFVRELPLLGWVLFPSVIIIFMQIALPQIFVYAFGRFQSCPPGGPCSERVAGYDLTYDISFLVVIAVFAFLSRALAWGLFEITGLVSALPLYRKLLESLAHVRTTFFDEVPSGRLLNRMVRDFDHLRTTGIIRISDFFNALGEVAIAGAVLCVASPEAALLVLPSTGLFLYLQANLAPIVHRCATLRTSRFGEVLHRETDFIDGARTFLLYDRADALAERLRHSFVRFLDANLFSAQVDAWGRFWSAGITAGYSCIALICIGFAVARGRIDIAVAAVMMTVVFRLGPSFGWLGWVTTYLLDTVAVARRIFEYVDLPIEESEEFSSPRNFSSEGALTLGPGDITFSSYSMSYRPNSEIILRDVNVTFRRGSKIGLIGRTGAGKSSFFQSLFRMVAVRGGDITVGGTSLFSAPAELIRSLFMVVPQDPYLFAGTVASNLDPDRRAPPIEAASTLEKVGLSLSLDHEILEGGKNLSLGERQLLCLARCLLLHREFILMDEPTSGIDPHTDLVIQRVLREHFSQATIITIAHRIETLARYDWIVRIEGGTVVQEGPPSTFLDLTTELSESRD